MKQLTSLIKKHADNISRYDEAIKAEEKAVIEILRKYVEETYVGQFIESKNNYCYVKSVESVETVMIDDKRRYMVKVLSDRYQKTHNQFNVLVQYKDWHTQLFFEIDGKRFEHSIPKNFNLSDYKVIDSKDRCSLLDCNAEPLTKYCIVHEFNNDALWEGVVDDFDPERKLFFVILDGSLEKRRYRGWELNKQRVRNH